MRTVTNLNSVDMEARRKFTEPPHMFSRLQRLIIDRRFLAAIFFGFLLISIIYRLALVWRPIDYTTNNPWRECDLGMIARNFWRGDMNILYPQIDWRDDGPGYVESELPLLSWLMASGYRLFGYHEQIGRLLTLIVSLVTLWAFYRLAHRLLPSFQAKIAFMFFSLNPILLDFSTNIQPDPWMLMAVILCVDHFIQWQDKDRARHFFFCAFWGAWAIAFKMPAAYLGLMFAMICLHKYGRKVFLEKKIWFLGLMIVIPPLLWYVHAHRLWLTYGNSLGISNETHWIGLDMVSRPGILLHKMIHLMKIEWRYNLPGIGFILLMAGMVRSIKSNLYPLYWLIAAYFFYFVALRTTADDWAYYYHNLSVPSICLLMGLSCSPLVLLRLKRYKRLDPFRNLYPRLIQLAFFGSSAAVASVRLR